MPGIPTSWRPLVAFQICGRGRWRRKRHETPRWFIEPPACLRANRTVVFCDALEGLSVLFAVLPVDCEGRFCSLAGSLPRVRRVISCVLFSPEHSRVVDLTVAEDRPDSILEPNVLSDEFAQLLSQRIYDYSKAILSNSMMLLSFHPTSDNDFLYL